MTIGIDASRAVRAIKTGVEHYSEQIIYHISRLDHTNKYILFAENPPAKGSLMDNLPSNFSWRIIPFGYLWTQIRLSWEMISWKHKLDVLFIPTHCIPMIHPKNTVICIPDLGFEHFPEIYSQKPIGPNNPIVKFFLEIGARIVTLGKYGNNELDYHRFTTRYAIKHATSIISISQFTEKDAIHIYHADKSKITVIYLSYDKKRFIPLDKSQYKIQSQKLTDKHKPYLFYVGRIEKKKNIMRLLQAYVILKKRYHIKEKLVLAGMPGLGYELIKKFIDSQPNNIKDNIIELGYVSDKDASFWMQNAKAFVFPTLFEGFGIPIIEAMACGIPVVCSNTTALPEVASDAALLVDPKDTQALAKEINKVVTDSNLRKNLIQKGLKRAQEFSWERSARETLDVILKSAK